MRLVKRMMIYKRQVGCGICFTGVLVIRYRGFIAEYGFETVTVCCDACNYMPSSYTVDKNGYLRAQPSMFKEKVRL